MSDQPKRSGDSRRFSRRAPLGKLSRQFAARLAPILTVIWLGLCAWFAIDLRTEGIGIHRVAEPMLPADQRSDSRTQWLLLRLDPEAPDGDPDTLLEAGVAIAQQMPGDRVPAAPPSAERDAWLDSHALYFLPLKAHDALRSRLEEQSIIAAVDGLQAQLSSPLFGVSGQEVRRDPLNLRALTREISPDSPWRSDRAGTVTTAGDRLSHDGTALLVRLRSTRSPEALEAAAHAAIADRPIEATVLGVAARRAAASQIVHESWQPLLWATFATLTLVLAFALRQVRPVIAILLGLSGGVLGVAALGPGLSLPSLPLLILMAGYVAAGGLHLPLTPGRGWPGAIVLGLSMVPLWLSPYPLWKTWSLAWPLAFLILVLALRLIVPAMLQVLRTKAQWPERGFLLTPLPVTAALISMGLLAGGALASEQLPYRGPHRTPVMQPELTRAETAMHESFFDPGRIAIAESRGASSAAALQQAAVDARVLATLVPAQAEWVDSPGRLVMPSDELHRRRASLATMQLPTRMEVLRETLESHGLRSAAFGEFLHGAADLTRVPTAEAALDGPLGPWVQAYVRQHEDEFTAHAWIHLLPDRDQPVSAARSPDGAVVPLRGPPVFARQDRERFTNWLGIYSALTLWLAAFVVWLTVRSLPIALTAALAGVVTESTVLATMLPLGQVLGPHVLPALLLVTAAATVAAARSCHAMELGRPILPGRELVIAGCQLAAGIALIAANHQPLYREIGVVIVIGAVVGSTIALFVGPGMCVLIRRMGRKTKHGT